MDDMQMEKLIAGIRENESKSQSLSETLMAFNESFTRLMAQIEAVGQLRKFETSHEKIISLEENIAGIKEDIELINTAQMVRLNELGRELEGKLKNEFKETLKNELKEEVLKGVDKIIDKKYIPYMAHTLTIDEKTYSIDDSRKLIHMHLLNKGNKAVENNNVERNGEKPIKVFESEIAIRGILKAYDQEHQSRVLVYLENGEVHIM